VHHNRIARLPPTLGISLTRLTDLDIAYNQVRFLDLYMYMYMLLYHFNIIELCVMHDMII